MCYQYIKVDASLTPVKLITIVKPEFSVITYQAHSVLYQRPDCICLMNGQRTSSTICEANIYRSLYFIQPSWNHNNE